MSASLAGSIHHVSFAVPELEPARRFYEDILGCRPLSRPDLPTPGIWLSAPGCEVHLILSPNAGHDDKPSAPNGMANHVAFRIDDYDATLRRLQNLGLRAVEGNSGIRQIFVQDPAGNVIELIATT